MSTLKQVTRLEKHGDVREDFFYWMKERDSVAVLEYLQSENDHVEKELQDTQGLQEQLFKEMRSRIKEDESSAPVPYGGYYYYSRFQKGSEYPLYVRKKGSLQGSEHLLFNVNELAQGHSYYHFLGPIMSPHHQIAAMAADTKGRRLYSFRFLDVQTGHFLADELPDTTGNGVWAADNKTFFFTKQHPETLRSYQVYRYELGGGDPVLVFEEQDETFSVSLSSSKQSMYIFIESHSTVTSEVRALHGNDSWFEAVVLAPRERYHEYTVIDGGDRFFIWTNWQAKNFRLMETSCSARCKEDWVEVVAHRPDVLLEDVDVFKTHIVMEARKNGLTQILVFDRATKQEKFIEFPEETYVAQLFPLPEYESPVFRYLYQSLVSPPVVLEVSLATGKRQVVKEKEVPGYDRSLYKTERRWAKSADGTLIPISLVAKKERLDKAHQRGGSADPLLLYGYGSYGFSMEPWFNSQIFSLVDRGFVYAIAHIRGGSELGRSWYEGGKLLNKQNTFKDFIGCAEYLIEQNLTSPHHLYIEGGSAGGLLVGAVLNMRPDLFHGAVAAVPFVDVITTMLDDSIPLTTSEYDEWGNPHDKKFYDYMKAYSPYDNVLRQDYPHLLVTTGYHDSQVQYWEPAKWVAKLRELKTNNKLLLFKTEMKAGHSGPSGRFSRLKETALNFAFYLKLEGGE